MHSSTLGKNFNQNIASNFNGIINIRPAIKRKNVNVGLLYKPRKVNAVINHNESVAKL